MPSKRHLAQSLKRFWGNDKWIKDCAEFFQDSPPLNSELHDTMGEIWSDMQYIFGEHKPCLLFTDLLVGQFRCFMFIVIGTDSFNKG